MKYCLIALGGARTP